MALNLSTLTSPSNNSVLEEINTTADFLEGVPLVKNLARGSNAGSSAKQDVALNQPKALPLDANGKGYCYLPVTTGNAPAVTFPTINVNDDFVLEMDVFLVNSTSFHLTSNNNGSRRFAIHGNELKFDPYSVTLSSALNAGACTLTIERIGNTGTLKQDGVVKATMGANFNAQSYDFNYLSFNGQYGTIVPPLNGYIQKVTLSIGGTEQLNIDFTAIGRHGDTKIKCATGQVVTINQSGPDSAKIIKRSVLRFDGVNNGLRGLFANNINGGYMFAAFSVLGDGGENFGRIFSVNSTGADDNNTSGAIFALRNAGTTTLDTYFQTNYRLPHVGLLDDENGDILHEVKIINGSQSSLVNNADLKSTALSTSISSEEFNVCVGSAANPNNTAIDLEFLALFSVDSVPDEATAKRIRDYINGRGAHLIYLRHQTDGYYFYDATKGPVGAIQSGSTAWSGRIVGSDNGDSATLLATQSTSNDAPVGDGFKVTFADNTDHLDIPSTTQAGWQVVGTSLGTFAYRVNANAVTELNLLGNLGNATFRKVGDLYGIILLPESASSADIESARKLLIDRGGSDGVSVTSLSTFWYDRSDILEFPHINTSNVTSFAYSWVNCSNLQSFPLLNSSSVLNMQNSWQNNISLKSFPAIQAENCSNFLSAWEGCSALTSFPAGAKLGTSASNVNFSNAFRSSGLTSFPALDLSTGSTFSNTFNGCSSLTTINSGVLLGTASTNVNFQNAFFGSGLTDLPSGLDLSKGSNFAQAFKNCSSLTAFPAGVFDTMGTPVSSCFGSTFVGCSALSATSVENILVSIDTSGQSAPSTGPQIHVDYNTATGSLSAATNSAVTSLKSKGWSIIVNNVTL